MKRPSLSSLRVRLLFLVLLAVIPALALIFYAAEQQRRSISIEAQQNALRLARLVSANQHDLIEGAHQLLTALAQVPTVRGPDAVACSAFLKNLLGQYPLYANFGVADLAGDIVCSAVSPKGRLAASDRPWFQQAIQTRDFTVGDYQVGRITGKAAINFGYPIVDPRGQIRGVVFAAVDLAWLHKLAGQTQLPPGATVTVIDRNGVILVRYPGPGNWIGKSIPEDQLSAVRDQTGKGTMEAVGMDGVRRLYGFTSLASGGSADYSVIVGLPTDLAFAPADRILARSVAWLLVVAALALTGAWWGGDWLIVQQVNRLLEATERLSRGDLGTRVSSSSSSGELHQLSCAFDQMAEALQKRENEAKQTQEEIQRHLQQSTALHQINVAATSTLDLRAALKVLMEKIDFLLPYTAVQVWLINQESRTWERAACWNLDEQMWKSRKLTDTPPS